MPGSFPRPNPDIQPNSGQIPPIPTARRCCRDTLDGRTIDPAYGLVLLKQL
jgi:hypothetical protein